MLTSLTQVRERLDRESDSRLLFDMPRETGFVGSASGGGSRGDSQRDGGGSSSHFGGSGSSSYAARYGMSPRAFRNEITHLKREIFVLTRELREVVDPPTRQRLAREIARMEPQLMERGVPL